MSGRRVTGREAIACDAVGAASTGATIKDLMRRLGHASPAASYRYLHAVDGRDAEIATALSDLAAYGDPAKLPRSIVIKH